MNQACESFQDEKCSDTHMPANKILSSPAYSKSVSVLQVLMGTLSYGQAGGHGPVEFQMSAVLLVIFHSNHDSERVKASEVWSRIVKPLKRG